jgi:hypothetical protein
MDIKLKQLKSNFTMVQVNHVQLFFSYETVIGFYTDKEGYVVSENLWGTTTGKHLNQVADKKYRIPRKDFMSKLSEVLGGAKND